MKAWKTKPLNGRYNFSFYMLFWQAVIGHICDRNGTYCLGVGVGTTVADSAGDGPMAGVDHNIPSAIFLVRVCVDIASGPNFENVTYKKYPNLKNKG